MKKLLTLLIMSFLVVASYAQSSVVKNDLRSDLQAKKSTGSLNIQDDESVPFCHTGLHVPRDCSDCGANGNWETIWFDGFGLIPDGDDTDWDDAYFGPDGYDPGDYAFYSLNNWFTTDVLNEDLVPDQATTDYVLNHKGLMITVDSSANPALYDNQIRKLIDTTTFNAYTTDYLGNPLNSHYSWWIGSNHPIFDHPGYGHWWYLALETDTVYRIQNGLDYVSLQFDAAWALQDGVDWVYVEARSFGSVNEIADINWNEPASGWFPIARYIFNERGTNDLGDDGDPESDFIQYEHYTVRLDGTPWADWDIDPTTDAPYARDFRGEIVQFRFLLGSDMTKDNEDDYLGDTPNAHGFFVDNITLWRENSRELIDDGGDTRLGMYRSLQMEGDDYPVISDYYHNTTIAGNDERSMLNAYMPDMVAHWNPHGTSNGIFPPSAPEAGWTNLTYYPNGNPYVYNKGRYAREVYDNIRSMPINLRYDIEGDPVHMWHPICLNFDYMMDLEERDGLGANTSDRSLRSDWWRVYVWDPQRSKVIHDSGPIRDLGGAYNDGFVEYGEIWLTNPAGLVDDDDNGLNDYWAHDADGFPTEDYIVYVNFEFFSNANPYFGEGVYIDNVHIYHKWDNGENNETFADAYNIESLFVDMGNYEEFHTTCAMLLPEVGGLYYPDYDEDFYKLYLTKDQFVDIVVDNEEVDLYIAIYDADGRLIVSDDGTSSNGMPYAVDYDRVIFTIDEDLPNIREGWYYIFVGASPDVAIDSEGRYRLSIRRGFSDADVIAVNDVPQDQGLQVRVQWNHSFLDDECIPVNWGNNDDGNPLQLNGIRVEKYTVWRKKGFEPNWDYVNQVIAVPNPIGLDPYGYVAATLVDNTTHYFRIGTHMFNGEINFGAEGNGKSLDNLAPNLALTAEQDLSVPLGIKVDWEVDYDDVETYQVYRSTSPGINTDLLTPIATVSGSVFQISDQDVEAGITYYYVVVGTDKGGNKGISNEDAASVTGVGESLVPDKYSLSNNYPNPFNPSTTIKFGLPVDANVTMKVFDILGQEVTTLISNTMKAGYHTFNFDASKLMSGMYIYRINAEGIDGSNFTDVKKMLLIK